MNPKLTCTPPGRRSRLIAEKSEKIFSYSTFRSYPLSLEGFSSYYLEDSDGNLLLDLDGGLGRIVLTASREDLKETLRQAVSKTLYVYPSLDLYNDLTLALAELLQKISPVKPCRVEIVSSGWEAVEEAFKLTAWYTRRPVVLALDGCWFGGGLAGLSLSSGRHTKRYTGSAYLPVIHIPYPRCSSCPHRMEYPDCDIYCISFIEEYLFKSTVQPEDVAAIFIQTPRALDLTAPPREYFPKLKKLADQYGILIVDCELFTSPGRTGRWFSLEAWDIRADVYIMGEGLSNGLPLGVVIADPKIMECEPTVTPPYGVTPLLSCSLAYRIIQILREENLVSQALSKGRTISRTLSKTISDLDLEGTIEGLGLYLGLNLDPVKAREASILSLRRGVIVKEYGTGVLRITPPLDISEETLEESMKLLTEVLASVKESS